MYRVYCDSFLLYDDQVQGYDIFSTKLEMELNKIGTFEYTIYNTHPSFDMMKRLKSIIQIFQDDFLLFRGRILNDEQGFYNEKKVECESEIAFLVDSIQRPFTFTGKVSDLFRRFISNHNAQVGTEQRFILGNCDISDSVAIEESGYLTTWESIQKKLLDVFGGYVWVRHESSGIYIDYVKELNYLSPQKIEFGKNLLDLKRETKGEDIATAIIPVGENGLTIASVNNGVDYVYNREAVDTYGWIFKVAKFDDISNASELMAKGNEYLEEQVLMFYTIELSAADLATVDKTVASFHLGTKVRVTTQPHSIDQLFLITKISIDLFRPASNKLTLGNAFYTMTEQAVKGQTSLQNQLVSISTNLDDIVSKSLAETEKRLSAELAATAEGISSTLKEEFYMKEDADAVISSISTQVTQNARAVEIKFTEFSQDLEAVVEGTDAEFQEIHKYIRFVDGNIILGESTNELTLKIENDRITFYDGFHPVAYFNNDKLYVTDGEFTNSLRLGNFAFVPRQTGNISFMKVV